MSNEESATVLPESRRPDGTLRPQVRVKKGYVPPEEQQTYDRWKDTQETGVPGADVVPQKGAPKSKTALKNEKRKERRKQEEEANDGAPHKELEPEPADDWEGAADTAEATEAAATVPAADSAKAPSEVEKKLKGLHKRLRQIEDLSEKAANGQALNPDQLAKVASKGEIEAEIAKWESIGDIDIPKRVKNLKKKLRQIEELEELSATGKQLNEDQQGKLIAKPDVNAEIALLESMMTKL